MNFEDFDNFFKMFKTYIFLECPVIVQSFKKILGVDSENNTHKVFGPILGSMPYIGTNRSFSKI